MPHKRPKQSVRVRAQKEQGSDIAPSKDSIANEGIPKSAARVLNALKIRGDFKKKRKAQEEAGEERSKRRKTGSGSEQLKILPGESIQHFNKRVEDDLRPLVKNAMESGRAVARKAQREEEEAKKDRKGKSKATPSSPEPLPKSKHKPPSTADAVGAQDSKPTSSAKPRKEKDFASAATSAPKRLNDIVQAPPELKKPVVKGAATSTGFKLGKLSASASSKSDVLSMAQKAMMEQEREKAIKRYREMKAARSGKGGD
ncbi:hypothetical protein FA13DRAFT_1794781 [Coprinellus micaceus]|uniref:Uncharacterized protein n=1 Tax=Coprinellus micaceus TaxID=71717 RepID=A0A4Y7SZU1_COPMI|nr:hypothetical protein FA13DRAFT_1794781 [Coprinellus micaceus]